MNYVEMSGLCATCKKDDPDAVCVGDQCALKLRPKQAAPDEIVDVPES